MPSPTVISFVNYKGGVGKTTLAVETAVAVAAWDNVRVLLCDLDPQTNATFYLFNPEDWGKWAAADATLLSLFEAQVSDRPLPALGNLIHPWSYLTSKGPVSIDVLPSHVELMPMDLRLAVRYGAEGSDAVSILRTALATLGDRYEVVICDCPPNMGLVTQNALVASDKYVIVAMPEYLSTLGIETLCGAVETLSRRVSTAAAKWGAAFPGPQLAGIVFNRVKTVTHGTLAQEATIDRIRAGRYGHAVFSAFVSETDRIAQRPQMNVPMVLSPGAIDQRYVQQIEAVAREFITKVV